VLPKSAWAFGRIAIAGLSILIMATLTPGQNHPQQHPAHAHNRFQTLGDILQYIATDWQTLSRSVSDCHTYKDIKVSDGRVLYLPAGVNAPPALTEAEKHCGIAVHNLPAKLSESDAAKIEPHGLLYLPNPYVVPGGQFNEMYGWDSYFIIRGLLRDGRIDAARGMVENFFYEIDHYGGVLNANRTYYIGRSQPPFLAAMILAVYDADKAAGHDDSAWLGRAYSYALRDYEQWTREPHLAGNTGLSRYFDEGEGPVPEILGGPDTYFRGVAEYFLLHAREADSYFSVVDPKHPPPGALPPFFELPECNGTENAAPGALKCKPGEAVVLSPNFYKGDRSMRESGFDVSFRFGAYGAETHHFAPVCLNSLLYATEVNLARMSEILGRPADAADWKRRAADRAQRISKYMWDSERGLFYDYNFVTGKRSTYDYATTFYPLWAAFASEEQARAVVANLKIFEQPGGIVMSRFESQAQWDYPYGWAPIHLLAIEGLRRYGDDTDADRVSLKFLSMILENFRRDHTLREKYDVVNRTAATHIHAGYAQNVTGFGWTNAVFLELLHQLPPDAVAQLKKD
jgi:alpha,alpha-trehalase